MSTRHHESIDSTWESLALLRFFLAMIVIAAHVTAYGHNAIVTKFASLSGFTAVVCFLIVSGYSIAHSVHRRTDGFYKRRIMRVYPLYAIAIIIPVAVQAFRSHLLPHQVSNAVQNLLFLQAFTTDPMFLNQVVWTLGVEVACYAAAPLLVRLSTRLLLCMVGVSAACYAVYPQFATRGWGTPYYAFLPYGGGILMLLWAWVGGFIYYRHRDNQSAAVALAVGVFSLMSLNSMFTGAFSNVTVAVTITSLTFGRTATMNSVVRKVASFAGDLSFPLYLLHIPLFHLVSGMLHQHSVPLLIAVALVGSALGIFIDNQLKRPVQVICEMSAAAAGALGRSAALTASSMYTARSEPSTLQVDSITPAPRLAA